MNATEHTLLVSISNLNTSGVNVALLVSVPSTIVSKDNSVIYFPFSNQAAYISHTSVRVSLLSKHIVRIVAEVTAVFPR